MSSKNAGFPWFFVVEGRPLKVMATRSGGMDVQILNLETGKLEKDLAYLARCFEPGQEVQRISEDEFNAQVEAIRATLTAD